jgi:hypothetical protein
VRSSPGGDATRCGSSASDSRLRELGYPPDEIGSSAPIKSGVSVVGKAILGLLLVVVFACTPAPQTNLVVGRVTPAPARIDGELAGISVEPASRDRAFDPLPPSLISLLPPWRAALQDALTRKAIFHSGAARRMSLMVKVLQYAVSGDALTLFARYQLFDNPAGDPIFSTDIMTNVPLGSGEDAASALRDQALGKPSHSGKYWTIPRPARNLRPAAAHRSTARLVAPLYASGRCLTRAGATGRPADTFDFR